MKKILVFGVFLMGTCFFLSGCGMKATIKETADLNEIEGVSMTIEKGSLTRTSATVVITDKSGNAYDYGTAFRIDQKKDGGWEELSTTGENYGFNSMAYQVDETHQLTFKQDWSHIYGKLNKGEYRIVKSAIPSELHGQVTEADQKYFSVEFVLE